MTIPKDVSLDTSRFIKVYSNLPIAERKLPVLVIDNEPISWNIAYNEIRNNTGFGKRILEKLVKLDLI